MVGSAVDTMVESREASAMPSINAAKMNINRRFVRTGIVGSASVTVDPSSSTI